MPALPGPGAAEMFPEGVKGEATHGAWHEEGWRMGQAVGSSHTEAG